MIKIGFVEEAYLDTVHVVWVATFRYIYICIYICIYAYIYIYIYIYEKKKTDADTMYGNTSLPGTHKAFVSHCQIMIQ